MNLLFALLSALLVAQVSNREIPVGNATGVRLNVTGSVHLTPVSGISSVRFHVVDYGPSTPPISISTSRTGARLNVTITGPSRSLLPFVGATGYQLEVSYPANLHVDLREFSGNVHVAGVTAPMELYDADGAVTVDDAAAPLTAEDDTGDITVASAHTSITLTAGTGNVNVTLAPGWRGSLVRLEASNGDLHLHVPPGFRGRYDVSAGGHVSNPLHSIPRAPLVFMLTEQGDATIATR